MNDHQSSEALTVIDQQLPVQHQNMAVGAALGVNEILAQVRLIQDVMGKVMKEGEHYGTIPGCGDKKTLLQPGAQKLTMTFRLAPRYEIQETNFPGGHKEYRVVCTLASITSGTFVGQGVGCCSTLEAKYRYRGGARKCPKCGKETIIKGKAEYGGGWLCFTKKGGCGEKWPDGAAIIESQSIEKVENENPADYFNTVLKMAKKRAFVDATITATAASDIFTQDVFDDEGDTAEEPKAPPAPKQSSTPQRPSTAPRTSSSSARGAGVTQPVAGSSAPAPAVSLAKDAEVFGEACKKQLLELAGKSPHPHLWWKYAVEHGWILSTEILDAARPTKVFGISLSATREVNKASAKAAFETCSKGVEAMAATIDLAEDADLKTAWETVLATYKTAQPPAPAAKQPAPAAKTVAPKAHAFGCPNCNSTATHPNPDYQGVYNCEKCGWQWELETGGAWEAHEWMGVLCPIPPKGTKKADYEPITLGQIMRTDRNRAYGLYMNNTVAKAMAGWTNAQGKHFPPKQEDLFFAQACEEAKAHLEADKEDRSKADDGDEPPF